MPAIIKDFKTRFASDFEKVYRVNNEFDYAFKADEQNRKRSTWNWRNYFAVNGEQWPDKTKIKLNDQNRHAAQYNIIGPKVDALTGSLFQEQFDLDWIPIEGIRNSNTEAVKDAYYGDKEVENYEKNFEAVIRDGLIYLGVLKVTMSDRNNPFYNIAMKRIEPGYVIFDPYWISDNDEDCEKAWEIFHLDAEQIAEKYNVSNAIIDQEIKDNRRLGINYTSQPRDPNELVLLGKRGHLHRVIEYHYMKNIKTSRLTGKRVDSDRWVNFPITKDTKALEKYMMQFNIDPLTIRETPYKDRIHKILTTAPGLVETKPLEEGLSAVQCKRLPYLQFTAARANGVNKGIVDDLVDIQQTINKRESKLTDLISTANGGGKLVNKNLFASPTERKEFEERANDPAYVGFVDGDELRKDGAMHYINSNQYPSQIVNQLMRMWDIVDRVSKVPAALEAISENANESGILFERKLQVARINTITLVNRVRDFRKNSGVCYYEQYQVAYNGQERTFVNNGRLTRINHRVFNEADGKVYIQNRPDQIPRCHVVATESRNSPNKMMRDRAVFSELYNLSTQTNPEYASVFFELLIDTMDLDDVHKQRVREISSLQQIRDKQRISTELANLISQTKQAGYAGVQAEMGIQQLLQQMNPQQQEPPVQQIPEEELPIDDARNVQVEIPQEESQLPENDDINALNSDLV